LSVLIFRLLLHMCFIRIIHRNKYSEWSDESGQKKSILSHLELTVILFFH